VSKLPPDHRTLTRSYPLFPTFPFILVKRELNRGFENLAYFGKYLYAILQVSFMVRFLTLALEIRWFVHLSSVQQRLLQLFSESSPMLADVLHRMHWQGYRGRVSGAE
jgi:hypothetical protein